MYLVCNWANSTFALERFTIEVVLSISRFWSEEIRVMIRSCSDLRCCSVEADSDEMVVLLPPEFFRTKDIIILYRCGPALCLLIYSFHELLFIVQQNVLLIKYMNSRYYSAAPDINRAKLHVYCRVLLYVYGIVDCR